MRVVIRSRADPKNLRVNIRYQDIRKLPPIVAEAMSTLVEDAMKAGEEQGWNPGPDARLSAEFTITMADRRADLDGPEKRVLDAIARGLRFNDVRVDYISLRRAVGEPGILAVVSTLDEPAPLEPPPVAEGDWYLVPGEVIPRWSS